MGNGSMNENKEISERKINFMEKKRDSKYLTKYIGKLRIISDATRKEHSNITNWIDEHHFRNKENGLALAFVLPTKGCKYARAKHGGCSFCTLPTDNPLAPSKEDISNLPSRCVEIFHKKEEEKGKIGAVKFYTSGSFLDPWEIPLEVRKELIYEFGKLVDEIVIETRCEYITRKQLDNLVKLGDRSKLIVAIGQETTNDAINERVNNKGHKFSQFQRAVKLLHEYKIRIKAYLLLKPIFVSEFISLYDAINSAKEMIDLGIKDISINPCYIGKGTLMEVLFKKNKYKPPWLWTVKNVTRIIKNLIGSGGVVICDPVAAGKERGPQNCGICDKEFKDVLKEFSKTQDLALLDKLQCECELIYDRLIQIESLSNSSGVMNIKSH